MKACVSGIRSEKLADQTKRNYCVIYIQISYFHTKFDLCIEYNTNIFIFISVYISTFSKFCVMYYIMNYKYHKKWEQFVKRIIKFCQNNIEIVP